MPTDQESGEIFARLRAVETAWARHEAECMIRNQMTDLSHAKTAEVLGNVVSRLGSLEESRAKFMGYMFGVAAAGSGVGGGIVAGVLKLLGG